MGRYVAIEDLVHSAAAIRTWDHRYFINLGDGRFYDRFQGQHVLLERVYPSIRTVYNSQHRAIAHRKHPRDKLTTIPPGAI